MGFDLMSDENFIKYVVIPDMNNYIHNSLPELDDKTFSHYETRLDTYYDYKVQKMIITCTINVIKTIKSEIGIPNEFLDMHDVSQVYKYLNVLSNDLKEKITGIPINRDYITLNGINYYPKTDGETND
jgi:hypothetical protein